MAQGKIYKWLDVNIGEFYKYIGQLLYMAMVKLDSIADYWYGDRITSFLCHFQYRSYHRTDTEHFLGTFTLATLKRMSRMTKKGHNRP